MPSKNRKRFGLSEREAAKLTQENINRTIKQCEKDGKPLPPTIAKIVAQIALGVETPSGSDYAKNKSELARAIGVSRPTLYNIWDKPGRPAVGDGERKYDVAAFKLWAQRVSQVDIPGMEVSAKDQVKIERENLGIKKLAVEVGKLTRDLVDRQEVNAAIDTANAVVNRELRKAFEHELPPQLEGLTAHEIQRECRRVLDDILIQLPKHLPGAVPEK
jgi:hypothetical protein